MKKFLVFSFTVFILLSFTGCKKTLIDTETIEAVRNGTKITVIDRVSGSKYNFNIIKHRGLNEEIKPYTAIETDTIKVNTGSILEIHDYTAGTIHKIIFNRGGVKHRGKSNQ